jgi:urease accessory protein
MSTANRKLAGAAFVTALLLACFPRAAWAHVGSEAGAGFLSGLLHPVFGLDHFLAMLSVGIVSAQLGGIRIFTVPATFVLSMIGGAVIGVRGSFWPFGEAAIAASVVVLGLAIAVVREQGASWPVLGVVAFFGTLHGHAHGVELPRSADPIYYAAGFVTSTTAIHLLGVGVGHVLTSRAPLVILLRHMGSAMAGMGLMILLNAMVVK